jgi:hypothetical protein
MTGLRPVRDAVAEDNDALLALAEQCPMEGEIGLCISRRPDFFALNRLEGDRWRVGVVDGPDGTAVGCLAIAERTVYLHGRPARTMYISDLKVHPDHRGGPAADALCEYARAVWLAAGGDTIPTFLTILAGNRSMQARLTGPRGLPNLHPFATVRAHSISLLWRRRTVPLDDGGWIEPAGPDDIEEMAALWQRVAPERHFATVHDGQSLAAWIEAAPGLDISDYRLARRRNGDLAGFVALWDQEVFKQTTITTYSRRLAGVRRLFNAAAPIVGAARLPPPGRVLRYLSAVNVCVPASTPDVLRSLLVHTYNERRGAGYSFITLGLDINDPLTAGMSGLLAQPTDSWACVATASGPYLGPDLAGRPVHHEIALV